MEANSPFLQRAGIKRLLIANLQRNLDNLSTHFGLTRPAQYKNKKSR
jgi:hypothetical protein